MKLRYIETLTHKWDTTLNRLVKHMATHLGYVIDSEFSTYQNYNSRSGTVGYWHVIHNQTGMSIGMVKCRKHATKVIAQYNTALFAHATITDSGFIEWNDRSAKAELHATWESMRESGLIVL